jgi:phenylalanyl-tRNA synthetase beta chain
MRFSLSWLRTHLDTEASLDALCTKLSAIGLEVDGVEDPGAALAPFRVARVAEAVQHPNADRLRVCTVDVGDAEPVQVVCGAPNARSGLLTVFAPPGSVIPATGTVLKVGEIRGVASRGMLVSTRELGLGEEHDGIIELGGDAAPGTPYARLAGLDDPVIEIGVTPNRGDALSVRGIARDLAAAGLGTLRPWAAEPVPAAFQTPLAWRDEWGEACPWVLGRMISGVHNGPSPEWLQRRLRSVGLRPISALVDITNFFTIDLGRPLHVFDADRVEGDTLTVRAARAGETLRALDGRERALEPGDCVIADAVGVQSLAGVMGGEATGVSAETTSVFVECALFDPVRVALTGRRLGIASDARARFERGLDQALPPAALEAATRMILDLCGGEASDVVSAGAEPAWQRTATLRFERVAGLGGAEIVADEAVALLDRLGFAAVARDEAKVTVVVPPWRNDVAARVHPGAEPVAAPGKSRPDEAATTAIEAECDLLEEVLRLHGLDAIPPVSLPRARAVPLPALTPRQMRAALARRVLATRGLSECVSFSFMASHEAALFGAPDEGLRLLNPIASDLDRMRPTPLASLALAAARNAARGMTEAALFEVGPGFGVLPGGAPSPAADTLQHLVAAALRSGTPARHWSGPQSPPGAMQAKADLLALLAALGVPMEALSVTADAPAHYHPGRSGTVRQGPRTVLGWFGELHPAVCQALALDGAAAGCEALLDAIPDPKRRRKGAPDLPAFQPVRRDFAFLVDEATPAEAVLRAARGAERGLIAGVSLFDRYGGDKVEAGRVSLAIEVTFQPRERTLTDAEIEAASDRVVQAVAKATGAVLRA